MRNNKKADSISNERFNVLKLHPSVKHFLFENLPPSLLRASTIKLKINGRCVNKCSFCKFHDDPSLLEVKDISKLFEMLNGHRYRGIVVNGGEPTIHPRFSDICDYLAEQFKGRVHLMLGTNLIPLMQPSEQYQNIYKKVLATFDHIEVGCDDEHRNIGILEKLAPDIVNHGLSMMVNVLNDYCSMQTMNRIQVLTCRLGITLCRSDIHHHYLGRPVRNKVSTPCKYRYQNFTIDCNGNAFYCYHQEFEQPLFNLFYVTKAEFDFYLSHHDPGYFKFCPICKIYKPENIFQRLARSSFSQCK